MIELTIESDRLGTCTLKLRHGTLDISAVFASSWACHCPRFVVESRLKSRMVLSTTDARTAKTLQEICFRSGSRTKPAVLPVHPPSTSRHLCGPNVHVQGGSGMSYQNGYGGLPAGMNMALGSGYGGQNYGGGGGGYGRGRGRGRGYGPRDNRDRGRDAPRREPGREIPESSTNRIKKMIIRFAEEDVSEPASTLDSLRDALYDRMVLFEGY